MNALTFGWRNDHAELIASNHNPLAILYQPGPGKATRIEMVDCQIIGEGDPEFDGHAHDNDN